MLLSAVIVNWNSKEFLGKCLKSIAGAGWNFLYEIVVIDAGSFDGAAEMVRADFPGVQFLQHDKNCGFAMANNLAYRKTHGEYLLFLNPDTEIEPKAIPCMLAAARSCSDAGVIGARLLNSDGSLQTSCVQSFPNLLNQLLDSEWLRNRTTHSHLWGMAPLFNKVDSPQEVDVISGACMLMERAVFEQAGYFRENYFMYSEDVDLCFKVRTLGRRNFIVNEARIIHHGGASTAQGQVSSFSSVMMVESRWTYFKLNHSLAYATAYRLGISCASLLRIALAGTGRVLACGSRSGADSWNGTIRKWSARFRWSLGF